MRGEESAPGIEHRGDDRGYGVVEQLASQQKRPGQREEGMQRQLPEQSARGDPDSVKRPMERIPCARLRIGQERRPGIQKRGPIRQPPGVHGIGEILLRGIGDVGQVPMDGRVRLKQRDRPEQNRDQDQGGPNESSGWRHDLGKHRGGSNPASAAAAAEGRERPGWRTRGCADDPPASRTAAPRADHRGWRNPRRSCPQELPCSTPVLLRR